MVASGVYAAALFLLWPVPLPEYLVASGDWLRLALAIFSVVLGLYFNDLYASVRVASRVALVLQLSQSLGVSLVLQTLLAYFGPELGLPRRIVLVGTFVAFPAMFFWRLAYSGFLWKLFGQQNVLLVGNDALARDLAIATRERPERGFRVIGYVGEPVAAEALPAGYLGSFEDLSSIVSSLKPDRVVVTCSDRRGGLPVEELLTLRERGVLIEEGARLYEILRTRICATEFRPTQYIFDQTLVHRPASLALQSIYINLLALAGLILLSPLILVLAIAVRISTKSTAFDPVVCLGYRTIPFTLRRFRTSKVADGGTRVLTTRLGRFLRRTHLDLLPALLNLWRGEMSLVGPRPFRSEIAEELARQIPFFRQRYAMKPGLTGWGQINMRARSGPPDALTSLEYDLYYLRNMSLSLDAYILLHQLRQALQFPA